MNKYSQYLSRKLCPEKRVLNDSNSPFKKKEKERDEKKSQLSGRWKVAMLNAPWKVPLLTSP
jgi:hypothetical protein